ncbi:hypothetical protein P3575_24470 [Vibrio parahaemolyticus]|nr:hypothetical protein [Vibrio parahaemolyticus]
MTGDEDVLSDSEVASSGVEDDFTCVTLVLPGVKVASVEVV